MAWHGMAWHGIWRDGTWPCLERWQKGLFAWEELPGGYWTVLILGLISKGLSWIFSRGGESSIHADNPKKANDNSALCILPDSHSTPPPSPHGRRQAMSTSADTCRFARTQGIPLARLVPRGTRHSSIFNLADLPSFFSFPAGQASPSPPLTNPAPRTASHSTPQASSQPASPGRLLSPHDDDTPQPVHHPPSSTTPTTQPQPAPTTLPHPPPAWPQQ